MTVAVIGGTGFIGQAVINEFREHGPISLSPTNGFDLLKYDSAKSKIEEIDPDLIINLSAHVGSLHYVTRYSADVITDNIQMVINLYRIVKEVNTEIKILNPIANCSYPGSMTYFTEDEYWNGSVHDSVWSYGNARKFQVAVAKSYNIQYGIKSINLIVPNAYGPGDSCDPDKTHAMNGIIIRLILCRNSNREVFSIWGSGEPIREWIYVDDIARIFKLAAENYGEILEPINLGQEYGISINESVNKIKSILNFQVDIQHDLNFPDGAPSKVMSSTKFKKLFPNYKFVSVDDGILETVQYYDKRL